jgi:hypothetical protein
MAPCVGAVGFPVPDFSQLPWSHLAVSGPKGDARKKPRLTLRIEPIGDELAGATARNDAVGNTQLVQGVAVRDIPDFPAPVPVLLPEEAKEGVNRRKRQRKRRARKAAASVQRASVEVVVVEEGVDVVVADTIRHLIDTAVVKAEGRANATGGEIVRFSTVTRSKEGMTAHSCNTLVTRL